MSFSPERAEIRFGCGLNPTLPAPVSPQALLDGLTGPDLMAAQFPVPPYSKTQDLMQRSHALRKARRAVRGKPEERDILDQLKALQGTARRDRLRGFEQTMLRWSSTRQGFRERLARFWSDHFTVVARSGITAGGVSAYVDEAIRPNIAGRFADLLFAAVTHPMMLLYLDQASSAGPNSTLARRSGGKRGLNENLAREVMELHTLGVNGPYTQDDVRQMAELFTGLSLSRSGAFKFRPGMAEPGPETVLGRSYGGDPATLAPIRGVLEDLARHPATARHIARKLAVHFVSDHPDAGLVAHVEARFRDTGGDLPAVYAALLEHPAAWSETPGNVKPPVDFVGSALRALAITPQQMERLGPKRIANRLLRPIGAMGQRWQRAPGPNGWPEEDEAWVTPQGLAMRLRWSMQVPRLLRPDLPDPRQFVGDALGGQAGPEVRFAARAAETRAEAIGLILASPDFQRR